MNKFKVKLNENMASDDNAREGTNTAKIQDNYREKFRKLKFSTEDKENTKLSIVQ